jgi:AcrR family transcriptional regulator
MAASDAKTSRAPLTRERILRAALELADTRGVESLKMRELGQALGFEAMALYRHVASKDEILDGVLDLVLSETQAPPASGDWADAIRGGAISVHEALERHPWATSLLASSSRLRPVRLDFMESLLGRLHDAGFSDEMTYHAYHVLDAYIFGFSLWLAGHSLTAAEQAAVLERVTREISFDNYPQLAKHRDQHLSEGPHRDVSAFEVGLDLILDGLTEMRDRA